MQQRQPSNQPHYTTTVGLCAGDARANYCLCNVRTSASSDGADSITWCHGGLFHALLQQPLSQAHEGLTTKPAHGAKMWRYYYIERAGICPHTDSHPRLIYILLPQRAGARSSRRQQRQPALSCLFEFTVVCLGALCRTLRSMSPYYVRTIIGRTFPVDPQPASGILLQALTII